MIQSFVDPAKIPKMHPLAKYHCFIMYIICEIDLTQELNKIQSDAMVSLHCWSVLLTEKVGVSSIQPACNIKYLRNFIKCGITRPEAQNAF